jgi:hypothetical protein
MTFYETPSGVEFSMTWENEAQFLAAKAFLDQLTGGEVYNTEGLTYYVLETEAQREALYDYRQDLRRGAAAR